MEGPRFIARLLDGETMAGLCAEFGISRKTGYKIYKRYKGCGRDGLTDRSHRAHRHANQLPMAIETLIVRLKKDYPTWGAPKIRERLRRRYATVRDNRGDRSGRSPAVRSPIKPRPLVDPRTHPR